MRNMWEPMSSNCSIDEIGLLPFIITSYDPRPVKDQIADRYEHGGGWEPYDDGAWAVDETDWVIQYPGDPPLRPRWITRVNGETVRVYRHAIVCVEHADGTHHVLRMD